MRIKSTTVFRDDSFPLACLRIADHRACAIHSHEFHELVVILTGHGRHVTDRGEYSLDAGDVFLVRGNMAHGYADTDRMTLVNILFDPKRLELPMADLRDLPGYHALFRVEPRLRAYDRFRSRLHLSEEELAEAAGQIARLEEELTRMAPGYRFHACAHLMSLIGFVSRCYSHSARLTNRPLLRMGEVLSYIEGHYREPIAVRQLVRMARMSESTLMRTFRRVLSRSPIEHVIRVRIDKAAELLQRGDVRVTEAAFACGFSDSNYFARQFRRVMGVSPREYRGRFQEAQGGVQPVAAGRYTYAS
jgi:AraC-like DNA-binding protein